jgi:hypothetical protein
LINSLNNRTSAVRAFRIIGRLRLVGCLFREALSTH